MAPLGWHGNRLPQRSRGWHKCKAGTCSSQVTRTSMQRSRTLSRHAHQHLGNDVSPPLDSPVKLSANESSVTSVHRDPTFPQETSQGKGADREDQIAKHMKLPAPGTWGQPSHSWVHGHRVRHAQLATLGGRSVPTVAAHSLMRVEIPRACEVKPTPPT